MDDYLGQLISDHVLIWFEWIESDKIVRNKAIPMSERKEAAIRCEHLVNKKYRSIKDMDDYFDKFKRD